MGKIKKKSPTFFIFFAFNIMKVSFSKSKKGVTKMVLFKIRLLFKLLIGVVFGNLIVIEDKGSICNTYVGSKISEKRFRLILLNQLGGIICQ